MSDTDIQLKAIDALVRIHTAIKNAQVYPPVNPTITNFVEALYLNLLETLRQDSPLVFAELEKKVLSGENILNQQQDETIHISSLLDILLGLGVKNISFDKDLEKEELHILINLLAKKPKAEQAEEDKVDQSPLVLENKTEQIRPDNKVFFEMEKDQEIVSEPDIAEENQVTVSGSVIVEDQISESIAKMEKIFTRLNAMHGATQALPSEEQVDMIKSLSVLAAEWIEKETTFTPEYKEICHRLQELVKEFINNGFFAAANPIIDVFSKINNGTLKKDDEVRKVSLEVLKNLASEDNINTLLRKLLIYEKNEKTGECYMLNRILAGLGDLIINKLLNIIENSSDSKERIRIIHIIEEIGHRAIPAIKQSINSYAQWYYLRNMAYILGRIGNEANAEILQPLLLHKDKRVRKEAFKSLSLTGGNKRGPLLLSILPGADQELRVNIIEMLGKVRCTEAVDDLLDMLKTKASMAKDEQISLQEKICNALGAIGSVEAIKTLSEIAESKSFLGIRSYPEEVKSAAKRAVAIIKRQHE